MTTKVYIITEDLVTTVMKKTTYSFQYLVYRIQKRTLPYSYFCSTCMDPGACGWATRYLVIRSDGNIQKFLSPDYETFSSKPNMVSV